MSVESGDLPLDFYEVKGSDGKRYQSSGKAYILSLSASHCWELEDDGELVDCDTDISRLAAYYNIRLHGPRG